MAAQMLDIDGLANLLLDERDKFEWEESDDNEEDQIESSNHNSESEQDCEDVEVNPTDLNDNNAEKRSNLYYKGKDKVTKWRKTRSPQNVRTRRNNIVLRLPGPKGKAKNIQTLEESMLLFLDDMILKHTVYCTNLYIKKISESFLRDRDCKPINLEEMKTFIGLLILSGLTKSSHRNLHELWEKDGLGIDVFRVTMNLRRFKFILRCLRFDDYRDRAERKKIDKLAPIREVFEMFINNCEKYYSVGENVTIDEELVSFRGRCSFRQYIPSKPARYGMKIFAMVDSKTWYTSTMEIYAGKQPDGPYNVSNSPRDLVNRVITKIEGTGRNITMDNWFCSIPLVNDLFNKNLTVVATLRSNKKELPPSFTNISEREINSSKFAFRNNMTLVSYVPKKKKNFILLSSMHFDDSIDEETHKPEIIMYYNSTKGAVDTVDHMLEAFSTARQTRRYPLRLFFHFVDTACLNGFIINHFNNPGSKMCRTKFLKDLGLSLIRKHPENRASDQHLGRSLRQKICNFVDMPIPRREQIQKLEKKQRCCVCPRSKDVKVKSACFHCQRIMCQKHMTLICDKCYTNQSSNEE